MRLSRWVVFGVAVSVVIARPSAIAAVPVSGSATTAPGPVGQRISLDLKGVDILDVLKLLSQKSGLNFVAGRNVSGRVTIFVNDVDVWEAFELIIGANDLAYERHGDIVTVMMARDYELIYGEKFQERKQSLVVPLKYAKVAQIASVMNQLKTSIGRVVADEGTNTLILSDVPTQLDEMKALLKQLDRPVESRVYNLNYAEAEKLKEKVQEALSPMGTFTFDARSNKVVITDVKESLVKTDRIINAFDVPEGQVLIEAKIVNVALTDEKNLGIDWQHLTDGLGVRGNFAEVAGDILSGVSSGSTSGAPKGGAFKLVSTKHKAQTVIEALRTIGKVETISEPRIMVSNNQEAKILIGTKEAFITATTTVPATGATVTAPTVQTQDVGTKLAVTPNVKRNGYIQLKIHPEVSSVARVISSANTVVPIVQTTEAETNVLVKSGVTLIIGGVIGTKDSHTNDQVPWLGQLPVIGLPFQGLSAQKRKTELVVFLTPQIVMPDGSPYAAPASENTEADAALPAVILQDPVPAAYRQVVRQRLQAHLANQFRAASLAGGSVVLSFVLSHDGRLAHEADITSPQGDVYIAAAKRALAEAQPFPSFPDGSQADEVRFRLAVEYAP